MSLLLDGLTWGFISFTIGVIGSAPVAISRPEASSIAVAAAFTLASLPSSRWSLASVPRQRALDGSQGRRLINRSNYPASDRSGQTSHAWEV